MYNTRCLSWKMQEHRWQSNRQINTRESQKCARANGTRDSTVTSQDRSSVSWLAGRYVLEKPPLGIRQGSSVTTLSHAAGFNYVTKIESRHAGGWRSCRHENISLGRHLIDLPSPEGTHGDASDVERWCSCIENWSKLSACACVHYTRYITPDITK